MLVTTVKIVTYCTYIHTYKEGRIYIFGFTKRLLFGTLHFKTASYSVHYNKKYFMYCMYVLDFSVRIVFNSLLFGTSARQLYL